MTLDSVNVASWSGRFERGDGPKGVTAADLMDHAVYDASRDEVTFTARGTAYVWPVVLESESEAKYWSSKRKVQP